MSRKKSSEKKQSMSLSAIEREFGLNKKIVDRCLPKPAVRHYPTSDGSWHYSRTWQRADVEAALQDPEVQAFLREKEEEKRRLEQYRAAAEQLASYDPEHLVARARELKRAFVLHVGPTNSGKTHDAMLALQAAGDGTYLGPLRLLALEMYDRLNGAGVRCSLLTGEESIPEDGAKIVSSTVELCDFTRRFRVAVIDEAQLITDPDRGCAWLNAICRVDAEEVHICLAPEALDVIENLVKEFRDPYVVVTHERLVPLTFAGECKGYRDIKPNDAVICFSRKNVLSTAALLERRGFKASVIYGALPPAARRNEVQRYLNGETNIIVATDAIGMGISLPIRRIVFAETQKFDGVERRPLNTAEIRQIAGRAGRYGMFEKGEVLTMNNPALVRNALSDAAPSVRRLCVGFPREVLDGDCPIDILLKAWQALPESRTFLREDMSDALRLYSALGNSAGEGSRELVYDLITCPVDTGVKELVFYWRDCARAILRNRWVPVPRFGTTTLEDCELQYKAFDIYHQLMQRTGQPDDTASEKEAVCERIRELMQKDKSSFILRCKYCGRELPLGSSFNVCDRCFAQRR